MTSLQGACGANTTDVTNNNNNMSKSDAGEPVSEAEAVASFLSIVNEVIRGNESVNPMSEKTALKFLISRKFNVQRAIQLYQMHEITRLREGLTCIDPNDEDLKAELNSGKFTILRQRDSNNSAIAIFTAKLHSPNKTKNLEAKKRIHKSTLQSIVYQLDSALENVLTQRNGIVFIYNMIDSEYSNFDYELCQKILNLLKGAYPAKLKKVLIVSPPLWFRAPFHLLRLIVREKLRDRVWLLNIDQLKDHIPPNALTTELGGHYQHSHQEWIEECHTAYKTKYDDICDQASAESLMKSMGSKSNINSRHQSIESTLGFGNNNNEDLCSQINNALVSKNSSRRQSKACVYDYDEFGVSLSQFVAMIRQKGARGLGNEYEMIVGSERAGTFKVSTNPVNMRKNRYINVVCYDHTRVVLEPYDLPEGVPPNDPMDYINASFVDGYRQSRAYISTQGPIESTFMDFWRMIWQTCCRVIVMVTLEIENEVIKCDRYWPTSDNRVMNLGIYRIEFIRSESHEDFITTTLKLTNTRSEVSRDIWHLQFISWPDFGVPSTGTALLKFRESVLKKQLDAIEYTGNTTYPPIVVHCSAGVGRSGTFVTIDICIQKLEMTGLIDVRSVVEKLRQQRYCSIQTRDQYIFCYKAVAEYAATCGQLVGENLDNLFHEMK
uniref:Tyrosine-protein phosphatase non-receptor type 9 n=2 Tax=Aceria tosichella TaxID=561515 RepID=A0A6G1S5L7_9ACAR